MMIVHWFLATIFFFLDKQNKFKSKCENDEREKKKYEQKSDTQIEFIRNLRNEWNLKREEKTIESFNLSSNANI